MISTRAAVRKFAALADPTRLRLLALLRRGELCVCDLMRLLRIPQPRTSRHLGHLRKAGLVRSRERGLWSFYSLAPARSRLHRELLRCLDRCAWEVPALRRDAARRRGMAWRPC